MQTKLLFAVLIIFLSFDDWARATEVDIGRWQELSPLPLGSCYAAATVVDESIVLAGGIAGCSGNTPHSITVSYDVNEGIWSTSANMPTARRGHAATTLGGKAYFVGAISPVSSVFEAYDLAANSWETLPPLPYAAGQLGLVAHDGKIFSIGGYRGDIISDVSVFDPSEQSWSAAGDFPVLADHVRAVEVSGSIIAVAGRAFGVDRRIPYIYNSELDEWQTGSGAPFEWGEHFGAVSWRNGLLIAGGTGASDKTQFYDVAKDTWAELAPLPEDRVVHSMVAVGDRVFLLGGAWGSGNTHRFYEFIPPPTCGDGELGLDEECDDGNFEDGDCCSSTCEIEPANTVCGPAADICDIEEVCDGTSPTCPADERLPDTDTDGTCDAYDICPDDADPSQADTDEDGLGDACDPCTGGIEAYKPLLKATNFATSAGDDKLKYKAKLIFDDAVSISPQTQGFRLLVEDADSEVLIDLDIPAGLYDPIARSGWIPTPNGKKFQYITKTPVDGMLPKVILKWNPKKANEVLVIVKGKSGDFADPNITLPLKATVSLDPTDAMTSLCAEAEFSGPKPLPYCRMSGNSVAVTCK